jgi:hypothetical protein
MARAADLKRRLGRLAPGGRGDGLAWARLVLGALLVADLAAALVIFKPWGGSAQDLFRQREALSRDVARRREAVLKLRGVVSKIETARRDADRFVAAYFLERRTVSSTVLAELDRLAKEAGVRQKEGSYLFEPVEGSDGLSIMTINAAYEGAYAELRRFLNLLDRSPRLLILSDLQAAPQTSGAALNVIMKLNAFVREQGGAAPALRSTAAVAPTGEATRP